MPSKSYLIVITNDTFNRSYHLGNPKGFRSFVPETGMKNKYTFFIINHTITSCLIKWLLSKRQKITSIGLDVEKRPFLCAIARNLSWRSSMESSMEIPQKIKNRITTWSSYSTSGYSSKEKKNSNLKRYMHPMFITVLLTIAKIWKQSRCPSTHEWINNMWYICIHTNGILFNHKR